MLKRRVAVQGRRSFYEVERTRTQVECVLRSFIVTLYSRLFRRLVARMNAAFCANVPGDGAGAELGLLDIYGFESLQRNGLEQLLINLTNERLQQFFVRHALVSEQQAYLQEGIPLRAVEPDDCSRSLDAVLGVLDLLDDHGRQRCRGLPASDDRFCSAAVRAHAAPAPGRAGPLPVRSARPRRPRGGLPVEQGAFLVAHYAGDVEYERQGWLDGNDAQPLPEVEALLRSSEQEWVRAAGGDGAAAVEGRQFRSVSRQHRRDLDALVSRLGSARVQFVRCFRPSRQETPGRVDPAYLLGQLASCGTVPLLRLMHQGFPHRLPLREVAARFGPLLPERLRAGSERTLARCAAPPPPPEGPSEGPHRRAPAEHFVFLVEG
ncbi:unnamed protein product [Prorocentrum cordatum]|uniref:Myosin motor domain-containing protein n=1 Tax=Prorocentrum cordatum TaxID=2364126 RepID=A0ABN9XI06_9DINO|nr:unnamed protein product [Polarella glacialis]